MRPHGMVLATITAGVVMAPAAAGVAGAAGVAAATGPRLINVSAHTAGPSLEIDFVERGLVPGQNYAYVGSSSKAVETVQCYKSSTFTPLPHTYQLTTTITSPDVRGYTANANGVVKGFVFVDAAIRLRDDCSGPGQEPVPIHITYTNFELVDIFTVAFVDVSGRFSGPIEPD